MTVIQSRVQTIGTTIPASGGMEDETSEPTIDLLGSGEAWYWHCAWSSNLTSSLYWRRMRRNVLLWSVSMASSMSRCSSFLCASLFSMSWKDSRDQQCQPVWSITRLNFICGVKVTKTVHELGWEGNKWRSPWLPMERLLCINLTKPTWR